MSRHSYEPSDTLRLAPPATMAARATWDEPAAVTPRGWLHRADGVTVGFYLDYGPDHYRSPHEYCQPDHPCRDCQPGDVLAVRYLNGPGTEPRASAWAETIAQAREFVAAPAAADEFMKGRVAEYHRSGFERSLLEYLGMTPDEYAGWFLTGTVPARVLRVWKLAEVTR